MFRELTSDLLDLTVAETGGRTRWYVDDPGCCFLCAMCSCWPGGYEAHMTSTDTCCPVR
jgi:hypothetical protein